MQEMLFSFPINLVNIGKLSIHHNICVFLKRVKESYSRNYTGNLQPTECKTLKKLSKLSKEQYELIRSGVK